MSEQFLATAFVAIRPDFKKFPAELKAGLKALSIETVPVTVVPVVKNFQAQLKEQIGPITPIEVPIALDATGFKEELAKLIASSQESLKLTVPIQANVTAVGRGEGAAAASKIQEQAAAVSVLAGANKKASTAAAVFADSVQRETEASNLLNAVLKGGLSVEEQQLVLTEAMKKAQAGLRPVILASASGIKVLTKAEQESLAARQKSVEGTIAAIQVEAERATAEKAAASGTVSINNKAADSELVLAEAKAKFDEATLISIDKIKTLDELKAASVSTNAALAAATDALTIAESQHNLVLVESIKEQEVQLKAQQQQIIQQRKIIKERQEQLAELGVFGRGLGATGLGAVGARGAVLAASGPFLLGAAAATGILKATEQAKEFETQLQAIQAATGADRSEILGVSKAARQLGSDLKLPLTSAIDAEQAIADLARSGHSLQESLKGVRGVLLLAASGELDITDASRITTQTLNAFNLSMEHSAEVADALTNATLSTQGDIKGLATALSNVASPAAKLGLSLTDTTGLLIQLAKGGIRVSDTGIVLRTALLRLTGPTGKAAKEIDKLGISIRDAQGQVRPDVFVRVAEAVAKLGTVRQRQEALTTIFSQRGIRAGLVFQAQGRSGFVLAQQQANRTGRALEEASKRADTLAGSATELKKNLTDAGNAIANPLVPAFRGLLDSLSGTARAIPGIVSGFKQLSQTQPIAAVASTIGSNIGLILSAATALTVFKKAQSSADQGRLGKLSKGIRSDIASIAFQLNFGKLRFQEFSKSLKAGFAAQGLTGGLRAASVGFKSLGASIAGAAAGFPLLEVGVLAAGAALFFLFTRESEMDKINKRLTESTEALAETMSKLQLATDSVKFDKQAVASAKLEQIGSRLEVQDARNALASSSAAKGSLERQQLELALVGALNRAKNATSDYRDAIIALQKAQVQQSVLSQQRKQNLIAEAGATEDLVNELLREARAKVAGPRGPRAIPGSDLDLKARQVALDKFIASQTKLAHTERLDTDEFVRDSGKRRRLLVELADLLGRLPTHKEFKLIFGAKDFEGSVQAFLRSVNTNLPREGSSGGQAYIQSILKQLGLLPPKIVDTIGPGINNAMGKLGQSGGESFVSGLTAGIQGLSTKLSIAVGSGAGVATQLAIAQQILIEQNKKLAAVQKEATAHPKNQNLQDQLAQAASDREAAFQQVQGLIGQQEQDAKDQAQKVQDRFDKADQSIINAITRGQQKLANRLSIAQTTATVADDIAITKSLLVFFRKKLTELKKRLVVLRKAHKDTTAIKQEIDVVVQAIFQASQIDLPGLIAQAHEEQHARFLERFDLKIQLANTLGNVNAEIRARKNKIKELRKELHDLIIHHKGATNEAIKLRIAIAEEQKAIEDLKDQNKERNNAFKELLFTFLQSQQGFAANLFGNLIPTNAASGLVGLPGTNGAQTTTDPLRQVSGGFEQPRGASQIASAFKTQAAVSDTSGPTRGGQSRELMLLEQIKNLLADLKRGSGAPDSKHERLKTGAANDHLGT